MHNCISTFLLFLDTFILEPLHFIFLPLQFGFVLFGLNQNLDVQLMWRPWHPNFNIHIVCFFEIGTKCLTEAPRYVPLNVGVDEKGKLPVWSLLGLRVAFFTHTVPSSS